MAYLHDPNATLDYAWDWSAWLPPLDEIASYTLLPSDGVEVVSHARVGSLVTAWLRVGATVPVGATVSVTCRVTTLNSPARVDDRTIELIVGPR
jgi:hypothetical protein